MAPGNHGNKVGNLPDTHDNTRYMKNFWKICIFALLSADTTAKHFQDLPILENLDAGDY